jgi:pimeloyl-ACP methyl ester carboxylesterase
MAQLVQQIIVREGIQQYIVLGHSMGGYIALSLAQQFPHGISGLGLIHSHPFADSEERKHGRRKSIDFIREHGKIHYLKQLFPGFFPPGYAQNHPEIVHTLLEISHSFSEDGICAALQAMAMREDTSHVLANFPNPVLFVLGKEDTLVPIDMMRDQTILPKKTVVHILEGIGHMSMFEAPEQLNHILEQYVKQIFTHKA